MGAATECPCCNLLQVNKEWLAVRMPDSPILNPPQLSALDASVGVSGGGPPARSVSEVDSDMEAVELQRAQAEAQRDAAHSRLSRWEGREGHGVLGAGRGSWGGAWGWVGRGDSSWKVHVVTERLARPALLTSCLPTVRFSMCELRGSGSRT